jgi:hypothetical protein
VDYYRYAQYFAAVRCALRALLTARRTTRKTRASIQTVRGREPSTTVAGFVRINRLDPLAKGNRILISRPIWAPRRTVAAVGAAAIAMLGGAQLLQSRAPDLRRLYASGMERGHVPPVIIIPGILGSRLRERGGREIWPGSIYNVLFSARSLALDIDPATLEPRADDVEAYDLFRGLLGSDYYGAIIDTLERQGGYVRGQPGRAADAGKRRFKILPK